MTEPLFADRYLELLDLYLAKVSPFDARLYLDEALVNFLKMPKPSPDISVIVTGLVERRRRMGERHYA